MKYYPINLNIKGKTCVVIGGGRVAERKIRNILLHGGMVRVISPELTIRLRALVDRGKVEYVRGEYRPNVLKGAFLVYATTSSRKVNARVTRDAQKEGLLVNVCDSVRESTFILPAILRKRGIAISVSTDGASPARSVHIRDRLKKLVDKEILLKNEG